MQALRGYGSTNQDYDHCGIAINPGQVLNLQHFILVGALIDTQQVKPQIIAIELFRSGGSQLILWRDDFPVSTNNGLFAASLILAASSLGSEIVA
jgi:hypothetical protein